MNKIHEYLDLKETSSMKNNIGLGYPKPILFDNIFIKSRHNDLIKSLNEFSMSYFKNELLRHNFYNKNGSYVLSIVVGEKIYRDDVVIGFSIMLADLKKMKNIKIDVFKGRLNKEKYSEFIFSEILKEKFDIFIKEISDFKCNQ